MVMVRTFVILQVLVVVRIALVGILAFGQAMVYALSATLVVLVAVVICMMIVALEVDAS